MARTDIDIDAFRRRLEEERARAIAESEQAGQSLSESEEFATGELTTHDDHQADIATDLYEREKDVLLRDNIRHVIDQIDHAMQKIQDGTYGLCDECLKEIPAERLELEPYAAYCIEDQERIEGNG